MQIMKSESTALILIDIQEGFNEEAYWGGNRNNKEAELKCAELLHHWRENKWPVIHTQHCSKNPNSPLHVSHPGNKFMEIVNPREGELVLTKDVNSAFIGTPLDSFLKSRGIKSLVIVGLVTNHCVSTTARISANLGYETFVVSDATATFDRKGVDGEIIPAEVMHKVALASLNEEFATILKAEQIINYEKTSV